MVVKRGNGQVIKRMLLPIQKCSSTLSTFLHSTVRIYAACPLPMRKIIVYPFEQGEIGPDLFKAAADRTAREEPGEQEREEIQSLREKINAALDLGLAERQQSLKASPITPLHFAGRLTSDRWRPATRSLFGRRVGLAVGLP
jgi:hypothetical protein